MTAVVAFDTLKFSNRLKAAGISAAQAEAQAQALSDAFAGSREDLATKADLFEIRSDLNQFKAEVKGEFLLLKWMVGVIVAGVLALVTKAFLHA